MTRIWSRLKYQRDKESDFNKSWTVAAKLPRGQVRIARREILWYWVKQGMTVTPALLKDTAQLVHIQKVGAESTWISEGRLRALVGDKEAEAYMKVSERRPQTALVGISQYLYSEDFALRHRPRHARQNVTRTLHIAGDDMLALEAAAPDFTTPDQYATASEEALEAYIVLLDQDGADTDGAPDGDAIIGSNVLQSAATSGGCNELPQQSVECPRTGARGSAAQSPVQG
jgi:hypothetical protein